MSVLFANTEIDGRVLFVGAARVEITDRESVALTRLLASAGTVVSREALADDLADRKLPNGNDLDVLIHHLRRRLRAVGSTIAIETLRLQGWMVRAQGSRRWVGLNDAEYEAILQCIDGHGNRRVADIARGAL